MRVQLLAAAVAFTVSATVFADEQPGQMTRAQVVSELEALHRAGYSPQDWVHYPDNIQAAERRVRAQHADAQTKAEH
ncbi:hypothetical protein PTKU46_96110 [Paraburkholderia terrae]|uniref:DUF4148 domain-containing protein n=1 Tax=Paraburkholderia terrae TaxID=311230 RepID=UPI0030E0C46E